MRNENEVIDSVCNHLHKDRNYKIIEKNYTYSKGYDIVAEKNGKKIFIEAKGQTTSKPSNRKDKEFTHAQKKTHVAMAVYKSMQTLEKENNCDVGIALPKDKAHIGIIERIKQSLDKLDIKVFLVDQKGNVCSV